jgi:hypothetical protein
MSGMQITDIQRLLLSSAEDMAFGLACLASPSIGFTQVSGIVASGWASEGMPVGDVALVFSLASCISYAADCHEESLADAAKRYAALLGIKLPAVPLEGDAIHIASVLHDSPVLGGLLANHAAMQSGEGVWVVPANDRERYLSLLPDEAALREYAHGNIIIPLKERMAA